MRPALVAAPLRQRAHLGKEHQPEEPDRAEDTEARVEREHGGGVPVKLAHDLPSELPLGSKVRVVCAGDMAREMGPPPPPSPPCHVLRTPFLMMAGITRGKKVRRLKS